MIFEGDADVWLVVLVVIVVNAVVSLLINIFTARASYKRGYEAAQTANEAMALGRLFEASRERYYAGDALARALEDPDGDRDAARREVDAEGRWMGGQSGPSSADRPTG